MQRVMIIGQPGSGKSTLARRLGEITYLPVYHVDHIHWQPGWVERPGREKDALCAEIHARECWIFEGGRSGTWPGRVARADTVIWLDLPYALRMRRVVWRTLVHYGRTRPDLPQGCPEQISLEFWRYIWRTRHWSRRQMELFFDAVPPDRRKLRLRSPREVRAFVASLGQAVAIGNLGIPHR